MVIVMAMRPKSIWHGDKEYKKFQPCQCDVCHDYRPANICIYQQGIGVICDQCQVKLSQDTNHENAAIQIQ